MENKKTVVVVNDDITQLCLISTVLEKNGFNVKSCVDVKHAFCVLNKSKPPDLIITDIQMPDIDGWAFCKMLRSGEYAGLENVPILVISAIYKDEKAGSISREIGADGFLASPFKTKELLENVNNLLSGKIRKKWVKILIIGNDEKNLLERSLKEHRYEVYCVEEGAKGGSKIEETSPEIIFIQDSLPDIEGIQMIEVIKGINSSLIIIMFTYDNNPGLSARLLQAGAEAYLFCPFDSKYPAFLCDKAVRERAFVKVESMLRKRTWELQESEQKYRDLIETLYEGVWVVNKDFETVYMSQRLTEMLGYEKNEMTGKSIDFFMNNKNITRYKDICQKVKNGMRKSGDFELIRNNKTKVYTTLNISPRFDPDELYSGLIMSVEDLTERKKTELKVKKVERNFRNTCDLLPAIIIEIDLNFNITYINYTGFNLLGYKREEIQDGNNVECLFHNEEYEKIEHFLQDIKLGEKVELEEYRLIKKDRTELYVLLNALPIIDNKKITGIRMSMVDISEKKELENQLYHSRKLDAIGQLAGGIAHDFNNILGGIVGYAELIREQYGKENADINKKSSAIYNAAIRAADLTAKMLAFSRQGKLRTIKINFHNIVNEVIAILERSIDKSIVIKKELYALKPFLEGDPVQIQNVIMNLALNARDSMQDGGEMVFRTDYSFIEAGHPEVRKHKIKSGSYLIFSISDTGIGMDEMTKQRIFEPFFTTKEVGKGTGLGLSSVYGTVKSHKGAIDVYSKLECGSTFKIYFPQVSDERSYTTEKIEQRIYNGKGTIMVVDDDEYVREVVVDFLKESGYRAIPMDNGVDALNFYSKNNKIIDLIILDVVMPKISGYECFVMLKKINPYVKVILSSGFSRNAKVEKIIQEGAIGFMHKPFDHAYLSKVVFKALRREKVVA